MMKIVHVIIGLNVGGAELMLKRLVLKGSKKDHFEHCVISLTDLGIIGPKLQDQGIKVYSLGMTSISSLPLTLLKLRKLIKKLRPEVVQTWMYHADLLGGITARSLGIENVVWNVRNTTINGRGTVATSIAKLCAKLSYTVPRKIVYVSKSALKSHQEFGYNDSISLVIFNGFDIDKFNYDLRARQQYRREFKISDSDILIGSVGRFSESKDHETFIKSIILATKSNSNIKGLLIGRDIDLNNFKISEEDKKKFIVIGQREDIASIYSCMDIFCLHSSSEGFPNVLGEAMSTGIPCVVTRAGDAEYILNQIEYTTNIRDVASLSKSLISLANLSHEERIEIGFKNRERIKENFEINVIVERYLDLYRLITQENKV